MQIEKVTITDKELNEAVEAWIKTKGIQVPVERVHKAYSYSSEWTVDFVDQKPPKPPPPAVETTEEAKG
jgi:hypothetical protein